MIRGDGNTGRRYGRGFMPPVDAAPPRRPLDGVLAIKGAVLKSSDERARCDFPLGGRPDRFPEVDLTFSTRDGALVAADVFHRKPDPESYWDIKVFEGRLWSSPGDDDRDRGCFPFRLSCERENDSHLGLAHFVWDGRRVSELFVEVVTETQPDHLPDDLDLRGSLEASFRSGDDPVAVPPPTRHWPIHPITELEGLVPDRLLGALLDHPAADGDIVSGLAMDGRIYATPIRTRQGLWPFPRAASFGVWSVTKAAFGTTALLRLARLLGPSVADTRITDVLDVTADHDGWKDVTIRHCLDMATGIGTAGRRASPPDIHVDNQTDMELASRPGIEGESTRAYQRWYAARSREEKLAEAFAAPSYSWGPGAVARYRDQDLFIAGAAMDALWKRHQGADADLASMIARDVFSVIGTDTLDINRTIEAGGGRGLPLTAFGLFLDLDDVARLGRLLSNLGRHEGEQLLDRSLAEQCLRCPWSGGLPTGTFTPDGREITYRLAYWQIPMTTLAGRDVRIATMRGYGGQVIQPLSNGITCFRFGHDSPAKEERFDPLILPRLADALVRL